MFIKHYYRIADAIMQVILLAVWAWALIANANWISVFYFIACGWFMTSLTIHFIISSNKFQRVYRLYAFICIVIVIIPLYGLTVLYVLIAEMYLLQYLLPVLALCYTYSCIAEIFYLRKRPISYLK